MRCEDCRKEVEIGKQKASSIAMSVVGEDIGT